MVKYIKDKRDSIRINSEVKAAMKKNGMSPQKALDYWIQANWEWIEKKLNGRTKAPKKGR